MGGGALQAGAAQVGQGVLVLVVPAHGGGGRAVGPGQGGPGDGAVGGDEAGGQGDGVGAGVAGLEDAVLGLQADGALHGLGGVVVHASSRSGTSLVTERIRSPRRPMRRSQPSGPAAEAISSF